ncbi:MAG: 16S rRNA (cytosine(1402)-N(4))-methyltransferase RsmH [Planctomycetota bacterium]|nr:MAG: 16S rRNA (cytosine(1402)-N(4))-methyltransferase RsmH [Planctomycetota bacterium]
MASSTPAELGPHIPVLCQTVVQQLALGPAARVLDCTCGAGGHARALLAQVSQVWGVDRDPHARSLLTQQMAAYGDDRFRLLPGTFAAVAAELVAAGTRFHGVLADLGVSSMQLDDEERGFGIRSAADADMRMGDGADLDCLSFIDATAEDELARIIREYGEERLAGRVARVLKEARARGERSAADLAAAVRRVIPGHHGRHPALRTFQALRIAINGELEQLQRLLELLPQLLLPGGKAVIISFHSLEDRLVKVAFREGRRAGVYDDISRRVLTADADEQAANRRSASAKLRWAQRAH